VPSSWRSGAPRGGSVARPDLLAAEPPASSMRASVTRAARGRARAAGSRSAWSRIASARRAWPRKAWSVPTRAANALEVDLAEALGGMARGLDLGERPAARRGRRGCGEPRRARASRDRSARVRARASASRSSFSASCGRPRLRMTAPASVRRTPRPALRGARGVLAAVAATSSARARSPWRAAISAGRASRRDRPARAARHGRGRLRVDRRALDRIARARQVSPDQVDLGRASRSRGPPRPASSLREDLDRPLEVGQRLSKRPRSPRSCRGRSAPRRPERVARARLELERPARGGPRPRRSRRAPRGRARPCRGRARSRAGRRPRGRARGAAFASSSARS